MSRGHRNRWRTLPASSESVRKALRAARDRGDIETTRALTLKALKLQARLYGKGTHDEPQG